MHSTDIQLSFFFFFTILRILETQVASQYCSGMYDSMYQLQKRI
jgi:hypothetical protein